jgi:hypothetical protein
VRFYDEEIAKKLICQVQITQISGRRCDMRTADLKMPDKIAQINRSVHEDPKESNSMVPPASYNPHVAN